MHVKMLVMQMNSDFFPFLQLLSATKCMCSAYDYKERKKGRVHHQSAIFQSMRTIWKKTSWILAHAEDFFFYFFLSFRLSIQV